MNATTRLRVAQKRPRSRFRGVSWDSARGKWAATIRQAGAPQRRVRIAHFDREKDAAAAYDRVAKSLYKRAAVPNFPSRPCRSATIQQVRAELRRRAKAKMTSRWEGVYLLRSRKHTIARPWAAEVRAPSGRLVYICAWATEEEAAVARDRAVLYYGGDPATLNFPRKAAALGPADVRALRAECQRARKASTSSRYRGVGWVPHMTCWRARITVNGTLAHLGVFIDEEAAARAYDAAARKAFGDRAVLNFPGPRASSRPHSPASKLRRA